MEDMNGARCRGRDAALPTGHPSSTSMCYWLGHTNIVWFKTDFILVMEFSVIFQSICFCFKDTNQSSRGMVCGIVGFIIKAWEIAYYIAFPLSDSPWTSTVIRLIKAQENDITNNNLTLSEHLLRFCSNYTMCINLSNLYNNSIFYSYLFFFDRWENRGPEWWNNMPKAT